MAVFTPITLEDARAFADCYDLAGDIVALTPISEGTDNSNYVLKTKDRSYILTIFESRLDPADLPAIFDFIASVARHVLPAPRALAARNGRTINTIKGKPAVLVEFLDGRSSERITGDEAAQAGDLLAKMHIMAEKEGTYGLPPNRLSLAAWHELARAFHDAMFDYDETAPALIESVLSAYEKDSAMLARLPRGAVHLDVFPDNVFFKDGHISGLIDFYFSGIDAYAYDLMLTANAWCFDASGQVDVALYRAFMDAYGAVRALNDAEKAALPLLGAATATRIALTRFRDYRKNAGDGATDVVFMPRDPGPYLNIIKSYRSGGLERIWA